MTAIRPALDIHVRAALFVAAIFSPSGASGGFLPSSAEWPTGDGWIVHVNPKEITHAEHDWEIPDSPLLPDAVIPKTVISVPTEFKFDITLTIQNNEKSMGHHGARFRHPVGSAHCGDGARHNWRPARCRGSMEHPRWQR